MALVRHLETSMWHMLTCFRRRNLDLRRPHSALDALSTVTVSTVRYACDFIRFHSLRSFTPACPDMSSPSPPLTSRLSSTECFSLPHLLYPSPPPLSSLTLTPSHPSSSPSSLTQSRPLSKSLSLSRRVNQGTLKRSSRRNSSSAHLPASVLHPCPRLWH